MNSGDKLFFVAGCKHVHGSLNVATEDFIYFWFFLPSVTHNFRLAFQNFEVT